MTISSDLAPHRWRAVATRTARDDDTFVYAVVTTGVFCRPACASRRPLRENVRFFDTPRAAADAGFRPCKRCRPADAHSPLEALMVRACARLREEGAPSNQALAEELGLTVFALQRSFKRALGITPGQFRRRVLTERAKERLPRSASVTAAVYEVGYGSSSRFYERTSAELGMAPSRLRGGARGVRVHYASRRCSLGVVLVAWTETGVADVRFGRSKEEVERGLAERFSLATRVSREKMPAFVGLIVDAVETPQTSVDVPLDLRGTAFQERVWRALRAIPVGETRTYDALAKALGSKTGARAVARACATNSVALVVPCHRVVRKDGALAGYRWGVERKSALLAREAASREGPVSATRRAAAGSADVGRAIKRR